MLRSTLEYDESIACDNRNENVKDNKNDDNCSSIKNKCNFNDNDRKNYDRKNYGGT